VACRWRGGEKAGVEDDEQLEISWHADAVLDGVNKFLVWVVRARRG
jgi:hypothetical protein